MTASYLSLAMSVYLFGLLALRRHRFALPGYLWSAFGLAAILVLVATVGEWHQSFGSAQAQLLSRAAEAVGIELASVGPATLVVPDPSGWSILTIGVECSTLIEASVFVGLILFYPRFPAGERVLRLFAGLGGTFLVNLLRLAVIVAIVTTLGKPAVPWAHVVIARLVFFVGIVVIYWRMLTMPTLSIVRRDLEVSGRAIM